MKKDKLEIEGLVDLQGVYEDTLALHVDNELLSEIFTKHFEGATYPEDYWTKSWRCKITIELIEIHDDSRAASQ